MGVPLVRPRVRDLVFQAYSRPLHPEFFDILAVRKVRKDEAELTIQITRTGHVLTWAAKDVCLTEVTAAADQVPALSHLLVGERLRGEQSRSIQCSDRISYQMSFQVEVLPPEIYRHVHDEILSDGGKRGLLHNFQPNHRLTVAPLGYVAVETRAGCLFVSTFHTFPEENTVVKTQSLIERGRAGK